LTQEDILNVCARLLRDLIGDDSIRLTMQTRREDVSGWDSFNYVSFIVALEAELGIRFNVADVESFDDVGAVVTQAMKLLRQKH
jgi:acyl carrier protein